MQLEVVSSNHHNKLHSSIRKRNAYEKVIQLEEIMIQLLWYPTTNVIKTQGFIVAL